MGVYKQNSEDFPSNEDKKEDLILQNGVNCSKMAILDRKQSPSDGTLNHNTRPPISLSPAEEVPFPIQLPVQR